VFFYIILVVVQVCSSDCISSLYCIILHLLEQKKRFDYPRRARSALGVDTVLTLDVCLYVCMYVCMYVRALERKRLIGMT